MNRLITLLACLSLSACATTGSEKAEVVWQALNALDTGISAQALSETCREANPLVISQSPAGIVITGTIFALVHHRLTQWLEDHDASRKALVAWHTLGIAVKSYAISHNLSQECN